MNILLTAKKLKSGSEKHCIAKKSLLTSKDLLNSTVISQNNLQLLLHKYHVIITLINPSDKDQTALAEDIYEKLRKSNIDVILDDRDERPGVKFKDADLIGIPFRINVGRDAADGKVELRGYFFIFFWKRY